MKRYGFAFSLLVFFLHSAARAEWVRYENNKFQFHLPPSWKVERDLYGVPIAILGPERGGERAVLEVQTTPLRDFTFDHQVSARAQKNYFEGRKKWLSQFDGSQFLSEIPYHKLASEVGLDGSEIGYRYKLRGRQFEERSIQLNCGGSFYLIKGLLSDKNSPQDRVELGKLISDFQCATVSAQDGPYVPSELHEIQDYLKRDRAKAWPTHADWKNSSLKQKAQTLVALVEFYKSYDLALSESDSTASLDSQDRSSFALFSSKLLALLSSEAQADGNYDCFFGGWPSKFVKGAGGGETCEYPNKTNPDYPKDACAGQLACNPSLFGNDLCVDVSTAQLRAHVTMECEFKFQSAGGKFEDLVKTKDFNQKLLDETIDSAKEVCSSQGSYISSNRGLCVTLENKLAGGLKSGVRPEADKESDEGFISNLASVDTPEIEDDLETLAKNWGAFESACFYQDDEKDEKGTVKNKKGDFKADVEGCPDHLAEMTTNFERIEKTNQKVAEQIAKAASGSEKNGTDCADCHKHKPAAVDDSAPPPASECTADQNAKQADQPEKNSCGVSDFLSGSCGKNLVRSLVKDLWSNVSSVFDLVGGNALMRAMHIEKPENDLSQKAHQMSKTSDGFLASCHRDGVMKTVWNTASEVAMAAIEGVKSFIANDAFCQVWKGTPHFGECVTPSGAAECMSCDKWANGICSLAGYAAGEMLPFVISGGISGFAEGSKGVKVVKMLAEAEKEGKLTAEIGEVSSKLPELGRVSEAGTDVIQQVEKSSKMAKALSAMKTGYRTLGKWEGAFKSKLFGNFKGVLAALERSKMGRGALKAGRGVKIAASIPFVPYKFAYKGASKLGFVIADYRANRIVLNMMKAEAAIAEGTAGAAALADTEKAIHGAQAASHVENGVVTAARTSTTVSVVLAPQLPKLIQASNQLEAFDQDMHALDHLYGRKGAKWEKVNELMDKQAKLLEETDKLVHTTGSAQVQLDAAKAAKKNLKELKNNINELSALAIKEDPHFKLPSQGFKKPFLLRVNRWMLFSGAKYAEALKRADKAQRELLVAQNDLTERLDKGEKLTSPEAIEELALLHTTEANATESYRESKEKQTAVHDAVMGLFASGNQLTEDQKKEIESVGLSVGGLMKEFQDKAGPNQAPGPAGAVPDHP